MKTLQELYSEIVKSDELKKQFTEAAKNNTVVDFAKANGVETTMDEIKAFLEGVQKANAELAPEELENAAGGTCNSNTAFEAGLSVLSLGISCAGFALVSGYVFGDEYSTGQTTDDNGRLCNRNGDQRSVFDIPLSHL